MKKKTGRSARSQVFWVAVPTTLLGFVATYYLVPLLGTNYKPLGIGMIVAVLVAAFFISRTGDPHSPTNMFGRGGGKEKE